MTQNERKQCPLSSSGIIFLTGSIVLFLGAISIFIWLLADASQTHQVSNIIYGAAFLCITIGVLIYSLLGMRHPRTSSIILWIMTTLGIITFIVGLCVKNPEPLPATFDDGTPPTTVTIE